MKLLLLFVGWCLLLVLCWPLALVALVLFPILWLISLPLRLIGITVEALFALLRMLLFLPARLLGFRKANAAVEPVSKSYELGKYSPVGTQTIGHRDLEA